MLRQQVTLFKTTLETFALRHRDAIRADPAFRAKFHDMCRAVGVDPLASNKGAFNRLLGFGDYYYALAVQVLEACRATRDADGGLSELGAVRRAVQRKRGSSADPVGDEDVVRAVEALAPLGGGLEVVRIGETRYVRSVPKELSSDVQCVIERARERGGKLTVDELAQATAWIRERAVEALETATELGAALVDDEPGAAEPAEKRGADAADRGEGAKSGRGGGEGPAGGCRRIYWVPAAGIDQAILRHKSEVAERAAKHASW